ncbi:MAG: hypothetical protein KAW02_06655 [candidate division Zixibacteria bacterium]|nr:hypothetical protein [candidate division Zixibacteria bacterium]
MQYQEYQERIRTRERIDKELPRLDFNLCDPINDPFNEKDIRLSNSKQWLLDIWQLYTEVRWSIMESFSYLELDYQLAFLYYIDNAIFRLYALREKVAQLINCYYDLKRKTEAVAFKDLLKNPKISSELRKVLLSLHGNAHFNNLIKEYRHPKTHREEPYVEERRNYRFIMKKISSKRVDLIAETGNNKWTIPMLKEHLLKAYEAILDFVANVMRLLFEGEVTVISRSRHSET